MFELTQYLLFVGASVLLLVTPGPAVLFVVARAVDHGRRAGVVSSLGLAIGTLVHLFAVVLGLSAILMTSAALYTGVKIAGAAYLIAMGVRRLLTRDEPKISNDKPPVASGKLLLEGVVVNALNPKPAIFFLAFLPQFADPSAGSVALQIMILGAVFIVATLLVFGGIAWSAGFLGDWLKKSPRSQVMMNRVAGTVFVGLALRLAITDHSS